MDVVIWIDRECDVSIPMTGSTISLGESFQRAMVQYNNTPETHPSEHVQDTPSVSTIQRSFSWLWNRDHPKDDRLPV